MSILMLNDVPGFCPANTEDAENVFMEFSIYKQCGDLGDENLIMKIGKDDIGGDGATFEDTPTYTEIMASSSTSAISNKYSALPISYTVPLQRGALSERVDELLYGGEYEDSTLFDGCKSIVIGDRTGQRVTRYQVVVDWFKSTSDATPYQRDIAPNTEITTTGGTVSGAGKNVSRVLILMPKVVSKEYALSGGRNDGRVFRHRCN